MRTFCGLLILSRTTRAERVFSCASALACVRAPTSILYATFDGLTELHTDKQHQIEKYNRQSINIYSDTAIYEKRSVRLLQRAQ